MDKISAYELSHLQGDLAPNLWRTLEALADVIERMESSGFTIRERTKTEVHVDVGPLRVFFRAAFGLGEPAYVQYGHLVLAAEGRTYPEVDGEWEIKYASRCPSSLSQRRRGERLVDRALDHVVRSVSEKHGDVRLVDGVVQPEHTLIEQDDR